MKKKDTKNISDKTTDIAKEGTCCSFCGNTAQDVRMMVAGPNNIYICEECITICYEVLLDNYKNELEEEKQKLEIVKKILT